MAFPSARNALMAVIIICVSFVIAAAVIAPVVLTVMAPYLPKTRTNTIGGAVDTSLDLIVPTVLLAGGYLAKKGLEYASII